MKVLNRTVTVRQLVLVAVMALTVGIGGSAVAANLAKEAPAPRANLGTEGGFNYRSETASLPGNAQTLIRANCPNSKSVTGGGVFSSALFGDTAVNSSNPFDDGDAGSTPDDGWLAYVDNYSGTTASGTVYAICK